jgi:hypothetical protein
LSGHLSSTQGLTEDDEEEEGEGKAADDEEAAGLAAVDALRQELRQRRKEADRWAVPCVRAHRRD